MQTRKFFYVYTDENNLIKNIETEKKDPKSFIEYQIHMDQSEPFLKLKNGWDSGLSRRSYILARGGERYMSFGEGKYFPKEVTYVYYEKKKKSITCISPILTDEYKDDKLITYGMVAFDSLVEGFISGEVSLVHYEIKETDSLLKFNKIDFYKEMELIDLHLLKADKISFIKKGRDIEVRYNRSRKKLTIHRVCETPISSIHIHFTKKNDQTILYQSINELFGDETTIVVSNIEIPMDFDVYSTLNNKIKFLYKEENGKNK